MAKKGELVATRVEKYYYDFLKKQADKQEMTISGLVRKVIEYQVNMRLGAMSVSLDDNQIVRLNEIAREKGMSADDVLTRVVSNYIDGYF